MYILVAGLNHRTAPVEIREKFAICGSDLQKGYSYFIDHPAIEGAVILSTCNRTEVYAVSKDINAGLSAIVSYFHEFSEFDTSILENYLYKYDCYDATRHLFEVISGLDSMILGESQIISQVLEAYRFSVENNASNNVINALFHKAMFVGKKVRTETAISSLPVSISHAAVDLAIEELGDLTSKNIIIIGAGDMSEITIKCLVQHGVSSVIVSNRTFARALELANNYNSRAIGFDVLPQELLNADLVISCTAASHQIITMEKYGSALTARNGKKIVFIDIAVPRDIDPHLTDINGVTIYDIDSLKNAVNDNLAERAKAAENAANIISNELEKFNEWLESFHVIPLITALKAHGEKIKERELKKAFNRLGNISDREKNIISSLANSIVNQLLHDPIVNIKGIAVKRPDSLDFNFVKELFDLSAREDCDHHGQVKIRDAR